jgi:hypothetical protein
MIGRPLPPIGLFNKKYENTGKREKAIFGRTRQNRNKRIQEKLISGQSIGKQGRSTRKEVKGGGNGF